MKKIIKLLSLALVVCLAIFAMTACGEDTEVKIGDNGNWFIGEEDTGVKAVCGKYVVDVKTTTELDTKWGKQYAVTVITYSDGTTETQKNEIPSKVNSIYIDSPYASYYAGYAPKLYLNVMDGNYNSFSIPITDDMYLGPKPDFNTAGVYDYIVVYRGCYAQNTITVLDSKDATVEDIWLENPCIRKGTPLSEVTLYANFNDRSYYVSLADCSALSVTDFNTVGNNFTLSATYGSLTEKINYCVYDPYVDNIENLSLNLNGPVTIPYNADAATVNSIIENELIGKSITANFYEEMFGTHSFDFSVTEDMVDTSKLNTAMLGSQFVTVTLEIDGLGYAEYPVFVYVGADLTGANVLKTYTNNTPAGSLLGNITAYDNGIAELTGGGGMSSIQATYTADGNKITAVTSGMTLYFTVDNDNDTYEVYVPDEQPSATYVAADEGMKFCVYSDVVTMGMYEEANGSDPEKHVPIYSMPKSVIVDGKITVMGMTITLNDDGTATISSSI